MTDTATTPPAATAASAPTADPAPPDPGGERAAAPAEPAVPPPSRAWLGVLAAFVAVALLAGATGVLYVRVQEAQDRADEAVVLAGGQDALEARITELDASLAALRTDGAATADDVAAAREQVSALRKCVNNALDAWAQATQAGKAVSITKC